ncbi:hypothetical protein HN747_01010 [archaeon]|jgi:hypothetical protein|nr:hypothetical protein [archaeon]
MIVITIIGFLGMLLILLAFLMNQRGKWDQKDFAYDFVNFLGAGLMAIYAYLISSWPFLVLNLFWMIYSAKDSLMDLKIFR